MITGHDILEAAAATTDEAERIKPGAWVKAALAAANQAEADGAPRADALAAAMQFLPPPVLKPRSGDELAFHMNIEAEDELEEANVAAVRRTMSALMRTPVVTAGAVMPDACPAGPVGTVPVGGVVASRAIHPGMHSADICCSMALSNYGAVDPAALLDAVHAVTHFGPGGRKDRVDLPAPVVARFEANPMLAGLLDLAHWHFATQGDGNHFAYVGRLASTGDTVLVTHHGSRGPGARLFKAGMAVAERLRVRRSPDTLKGNAWIEPDTAEGETYWDALQGVREWTRESHFAIHDMARERLGARVQDRFWNEHNFVFRRSDGLFYHGKGATPAFAGWAPDAGAHTLIPLNMAEPVLVARGLDAAHGLGFAPHGAGRNMSRSAHKRALEGRSDEEVFAEETAHIDARFFCGRVDVSELPSAYKNAAAVRAQIDRFALAEIVDEVVPHGSIMAGDWEHDAPWVVRRREKQAVREAEVREAGAREAGAREAGMGKEQT